MTRRAAVRHAAGGLAFMAVGFARKPSLASTFLSEDEVTPSEQDAMGKIAANFMEKFSVPGLSIAIAHGTKLAYQQAFGMADSKTGERVSISHLFRIASVSKPLTSVAIFTLVERGAIRRTDTVFGKNGILGDRFGAPPYGRYVEDITIDDLLTHTCGGWASDRDDPMFLNPKLDVGLLISRTIKDRPLGNPPSKHFAYSNFGYCVLGRVIEAKTQQTYRDYVQKEVLAPSGISDMRISGNTKKDRAPNEVIYYGQHGENPYQMNVQRMDSNGGWLASPADLVSFAIHVNGFTTAPNILRADTIKTMTTHCDADESYARGWDVNKQGTWWHIGSLPGTAAIMVRTSSGFCWAALANTRHLPKDDMNLALDKMVWDMARKVHNWRL